MEFFDNQGNSLGTASMQEPNPYNPYLEFLGGAHCLGIAYVDIYTTCSPWEVDNLSFCNVPLPDCEPPANQPVLYGVNSNDDGLSAIDPNTGAVTFIGKLDTAPATYATPIAMSIRPLDGEIFVWNNSEGLNPYKTTGVLLTVNRNTGRATQISPSNQGPLDALAFAPDGTLYGLSGTLSTIDSSGIKAEVGNSSIGYRIGGADFNNSGTLYGVQLTTPKLDQELVTIDTTTGIGTPVGTVTGIGTIGSIEFTPNGTLIGSGFNGPRGSILFDIDTTTGTASNFRSITGALSSPQGMGFSHPPLPNDPPVADAGSNNPDGPGYIDIEGKPDLILSAVGSTDPDGDSLQIRWDVNNDGYWDTEWLPYPGGHGVNWEDDYEGMVTVKVFDGVDTDTATVPVSISNASPTIDINTLKANPNPAQVGETVDVKALFKDPGVLDTHDDSTFDWGDGSDPTPATISPGDRPGDHKASSTHAYDAPGVYDVTLTIIDDDEGEDEAVITVIVVGDADQIRTIGYWKHQIGAKKPHIDGDTMEAYINIVSEMTEVFDDPTLEEVEDLLWLKKSTIEERAVQQFLASWLNYANGAVALDSMVDTNYDSFADMRFKDAMSTAEDIILYGSDYELAKDICDSINNMDN
jgi:hypothetical protein